METTALYKQILEAAGDIKPKNISVDTLSRAFAGSEIDRSQVYGFANHMQALARRRKRFRDGPKPSQPAGMSSGSGISGSTAWHGAFRFRQYLKGTKPADGEQPDNDIREIEFKKNQYGPRAEQSSCDTATACSCPKAGHRACRRSHARTWQIKHSWRFWRASLSQGRNVGDKPTSPTYAPATFTKEAEARKHMLTKPELENAMRRLFEAGKILVSQYGRPSRPATCIVVK